MIHCLATTETCGTRVEKKKERMQLPGAERLLIIYYNYYYHYVMYALRAYKVNFKRFTL